jgi:hypothetical protein
MERMPVSQHLHPTKQESDIQKTAASHSQQQPQQATTEQASDLAPQRIPARLTTAFLKKHKPNKKAAGSISLQITRRRQGFHQRGPLFLETTTALAKSSALPHLSQAPTTSAVSVTNISVRMHSQSVRQPKCVRPSGHCTYSGPDPWYQPNPVNQHHPTGASGRSPTYVPATQRPVQASAANSASKRKPKPIAIALENFLSSSKDHQKKIKETAEPTSRVPPAVPDAPRPKMQGPPPTPRITRLPTPDLPEVGGTTFCTCQATSCSKPVHLYTDAQGTKDVCPCNGTNCNKPFHFKMKVQSKKPSAPSTE